MERLEADEFRIRRELRAAGPPPSIECWRSIGSTMDRAREICRDSRAAGFSAVVTAREQVAGRGRQGRAWSSTEGALMVTAAWGFPRAAVSSLIGLSLATGVVIAELLEGRRGAVRLKWPNDLLSPEGEKVGGVLIELDECGDVTSLLIGIGLNLREAPAGVERAAAVRFEGVSPPSAVEILPDLLADLDEMASRFVETGLEPYRERWAKRALGIGGPIAIDTGSEVREGILTGISARGGALVVGRGGETHEVLSGHVTRWSNG